MAYFDVKSFLKEYERFPCLWQKQCPDFKNRLKRDEAEETLLPISGLPNVKLLRRKIRSIRCTYNQEVAKIKKSKTFAISANDIYQPKLAWFHIADRFLRQNENIDSDSNMILTKREHEDEIDETIDDEQPLFIGLDSPLERHSPTPPRRLGTCSCGTKKQKFDDILDNTVEVLNHVVAQPQSVTNEFTSFGQHVATQLSCLPLKEAIMLQEEIQKVITVARLRTLKKGHSQSLCNCSL